MDFLNNSFAQLSDLFRSMTVGARITAALLLIVVVVSLAWMFQYQVYGGDTELFSGQSFSTSDLNAMQAAFAQAGLGGFEVVGSRIRIPRQQQAAYIAALADAKALPANWNEYMSRALESSNPFASTREREDRLRIATQQEISLVLRSMKDVANATVHYDSQKKSGFNPRERVATASVMIQMVGSRSLDEERVQMIREMVAGCFADLTADKVKVADLNGRVYFTSEGDGLGGSGGNHRYIITKDKFQKQYEANIQAALAYVPGVTVAVNVELEKDLRTSRRVQKFDPKVTPFERREETSGIKSSAAPRGGPPGLQQQQPKPNQPVNIGESAKGSTNEEDRSFIEERNAVNNDVVETEEIGLTPKRVTVSVGVPSGFLEDVWRRKNSAPDGQPPQPPDAKALAQIEEEERKRIQAHVVPLIPKPADELDPTPLVTVTTFTEIPQDPIELPGVGTQAVGWLSENWKTLGLGGLVLVSLMMVRSMVRTAPPPAKALEFNLPPISETAEKKAEGQPQTAGENAKSRLKRKVSSGQSLRDELVEMVKEDPDTAANILRGWIGAANQ